MSGVVGVLYKIGTYAVSKKDSSCFKMATFFLRIRLFSF